MIRNQLNPAVRWSDALCLNPQIFSLTIDAHQPLGNAHNAFDPTNRSQTRPLQNTYGIKSCFSIENPAAGLMALATAQATPPALVSGQVQRRQPLFLSVGMIVFGAGGQLAAV